MTSRIPFLAAVLAFAASLFVGGCAYLPGSVQEPRVHLAGLQLTQVDVFEQRYRLRLRIQNPNDFDLRIRGLDFKVELNGQHFAEGVSNQSVEVPRYGEAVAEVEVSSNLWSLARQLRDMGDKAAEGMEYRLHGRIALDGRAAPVPFDTSGDLGVGPTGE